MKSEYSSQRQEAMTQLRQRISPETLQRSRDPEDFEMFEDTFFRQALGNLTLALERRPEYAPFIEGQMQAQGMLTIVNAFLTYDTQNLPQLDERELLVLQQRARRKIRMQADSTYLADVLRFANKRIG
jgi:hypothetical protein